MKPPALFSVDLSNVPAAPCSIIMASSPLLLRRQCLSPLGPSLSTRPPSLYHRSLLPERPPSRLRWLCLIVFSFSFVLLRRRVQPVPRPPCRPSLRAPSRPALVGTVSHRPFVRTGEEATLPSLPPPLRSPRASTRPSNPPTPGSPMPR